jgi:DNA-binding Lrp family transcriptional regulator
MAKMNKKQPIENQIMDILLYNSKTPYREIASKLKISIGTVTNKIKQLEKSGLIKRYTVTVDYEKLGYNFEVLIFVKIDKGKFPILSEKYMKNPDVFLIYDITGAFDAVISAKFRTRRELDSFLKLLQAEEYVNYTNTNLILNIKREEKIT